MTAAKRHYLTKEQEALFDSCVKKWAPRLGLADWVIYRRPMRAVGARADIDPNFEARQAGYRTGNFGVIAPTDHDIELTAVHELWHVVLAGLIHVVTNTEDVTLIASEEHRVINMATELLLALEKGPT